MSDNIYFDAIKRSYEKALEKPNTAENREWLKKRIDHVFKMCDIANVSRPVDYNISISNTGELEVFFAQQYTK